MSEAAELLALESAGNTIRFNEGSFLHLAACQGDAETVRLLLARCEDPYLVNSGGNSPMSLAEEQGHDEVIPVMRERKR